VYLHELVRTEPHVRGVITATRGNHGQSVAFAAQRHGIAATIVVPHGNSVEKNAAMRALGAELVVHGRDFQEAREHMQRLAVERDLHELPSFHPWLVRGVAGYALEFFEAVPDLDRVYVPIGLGSGIAGVIAVRDALESKAEIVGVVAAKADAYARSFEARKPIATENADTFADGVAVRVPDPQALDIILHGAARVARVTDGEIKAAMRAFFTDTHTVAEGAGAAPLAAAMRDREELKGKKIGLVLSGGNVDRDAFAKILAA
jgi:threonine dehydratase